MADARTQFQVVLRELTTGNFVDGTDEDRANTIKKLHTEVTKLVDITTQPLTMEQIVDHNASLVDTSTTSVPKGISVDIANDLKTLNDLAAADTATQDAALDVASTVANILLKLAPLLIAA